MKQFELKIGTKEIPLAQLKIHENDYDKMNYEQVTTCINHFLKFNDVNGAVSLTSKQVYRDITINDNSKIRMSTKDEFVTITYIKREDNYIIEEIKD